MAELTPMMRQYKEVKRQHPDCIVFFRLGDFYEMFGEDAYLAAKELDLTLTTRDRGKEKSEQTPMCGIPYHSAESYIARLVQRGHKVAICEQMEDPALAKGLVKRDITRIVTPGSVVESSMLDESRNNYFACVYGGAERYGLSFCDISTGAFLSTFAQGEGALDRIISELGRFLPAEVLRGGEAAQNKRLTDVLQNRLHCCGDVGADALFDEADTVRRIEQQFGRSLAALGIAGKAEVIRSAGALLRTLSELQRASISHVQYFEFYTGGRYLEMDLTARRNLELTETLRSGEKRGSLLGVLDKASTAMGSRMLRAWLERPLLDPSRIRLRQDAVEELTTMTIGRDELRRLLRQVSDLERVTARIVTGAANGRDLVMLQNGCAPLPALREAFAGCKAPLFDTLRKELDDLRDIHDRIAATIADDPPFSLREGGLIRAGYHEELDRLRDILSGGKGTLARIETTEREKTGIKTLRVGYNRVFGYYIEVSKGQTSMVPETYIRRQTLATGERYITPELKELESSILSAKDRITALEYDLFVQLRDELAEQTERIQRTARAVAYLDVLNCLAELAVKNRYCKPEVDRSGIIDIRDGRHPVVEQMLKDALFVPNDTYMDENNDRALIITGPNMAGKSTYMRQVALIVLLAQMGSFVPARSARVGVVDRIFTRIGASDDLSGGQSTFMVEMSEVAEILSHATAHSLILLDEIGRGTSTFDGMAIARAVLEYTADRKRLGAKTLFATHYHELTTAQRELSGVKNYNIAVKKRGDEIVFLRKIVAGAADDSYGVEVAALAGLPQPVIDRAKRILHSLEQGAPAPAAPKSVAAQEAPQEDLLRCAMRGLTVETMTPIEAMNALYELKKLL